MTNISVIGMAEEEEEGEAGLSVLDFILETSILILLGLVGAVGHGIVLVYNLFLKPRTKLKSLEILIINSGLADFVLSVVFLPVQVNMK